MKKALFTGTFDPPSFGHLDIIERACKLCDKLYIGVATNILKPKDNFFTIEEKIELLKSITQKLPQVEIVTISELVVEYAKKNKIDALIRGIRAYSDYEFEFRMAWANRKLSGIETIFLMADERYAHISSSLIRELASYKTRLKDFVPAPIENKVFERLSEGPKDYT